ncbi:MAG TPA: sigma-70 family RNA polymerase sigma factor [Candidatus Didemnitutus sp.]
MTEAELIARAVAADDRSAFGALVRSHQSSVRHFLRRLTRGDTAQADDLAQETFLRAYRGLARFERRASFSTWLLGIAHNLWRNDRRKPRAISLEAEHLDTLEPEPSPAPAADFRADLEKALLALSPEERTVVHLCHQQGFTHDEAAAILQIPLGTVKTHLHRGRDSLRRHLAPWNPTH